jgi:hypothetical protein
MNKHLNFHRLALLAGLVLAGQTFLLADNLAQDRTPAPAYAHNGDRAPAAPPMSY